MANPDKQNQVDDNGDVEHQTTSTTTTAPAAAGGGRRLVITMTWKKDDVVKKGPVLLRGLALLFAFISFVIMACNQQGPGLDFTDHEPYEYLLSIGVIATVYTGAQTVLHLFADKALSPCTSAVLDFVGDQVMAYLLISSVSSAIPMTNALRKSGLDITFDEYGAASVSMAFFAFFLLALSSLISAFKLSTTLP